ncbi:Eco57I restriction-modification methylase domain-containing protein [Actinomycetes bacterium M1A6_2h]
MDLLERAEARRISTLADIDETQQSSRGQYFTPAAAARLIAQLPRLPRGNSMRVLDPGAGSGILTAALAQRVHAERPDMRLHVVAVENDEALHPALTETLSEVAETTGASFEIVNDDFLVWSLTEPESFDLVIQNPPYAKLRSGSPEQTRLRRAGVTVPNIYAAFMALGAELLKPGGQQVAITPRSWMNGTYYATFRRHYVEAMGIDAIHTFESRSTIFRDTGVLQESVIVSATAGEHPSHVKIYTSHGHQDEATVRTAQYEEIVTPDFIHIPASDEDAQAVAWMTRHATMTLAELGLTVSTGRVVDFRARELLHTTPMPGCVPMVSAPHVRGGSCTHPAGSKKPEWFHADPITSAKLLVPAGTYVLIKRFSSKEERRRVVASVWSSETPAAFDNKLNFIHTAGQGIDNVLARGLERFLNSTQLDRYFRVFSGHTQVNATDLRQMRFPTRDQLRLLARYEVSDQDHLDVAVQDVLNQPQEAA